MTILSPEPLTRPVARELMRRTDRTLLRNLEYLAISGLRLEGRVLDVGGGRRSGYTSMMTVTGRFDSVNVDASLEPTCVGDMTHGLPIVTAACDHVLAFNTLEHILDDGFALNEIVRVLRPGGTAYILVPFLYRVHASPDDFHRHTASSWTKALQARGITEDRIQIKPLTFGPLAAPLSLLEFRVPRWARWFMRMVVLQWTLARNAMSRNARQDDGADLALGYFIQFSKTA